MGKTGLDSFSRHWPLMRAWLSWGKARQGAARRSKAALLDCHPCVWLYLLLNALNPYE